MVVQYEWDVELQVHYAEVVAGEDMDVLEHHHTESLEEALSIAIQEPERHPEGKTSHNLVLVRDDAGGRSWAYVEGGMLPEFFEDADGKQKAKVPQKFHKELDKLLRRDKVQQQKQRSHDA